MSTAINETNIWKIMKQAFPILEGKLEMALFDVQGIQPAVQLIKKYNVEEKMEEIMLIKINELLYKEFVPTFWSYFTSAENTTPSEMFKQFVQAINYLFGIYNRLGMILNGWCCARKIDDYSKLQDKLLLQIKTNLLAQLPDNYQNVVYNFYECSLKMQETDEELTELCLACLQDRNQCSCFEIFAQTNLNLGSMKLLGGMCDQTITDLVYSFIEGHIRKICKDSYDISYISSLEDWLRSTIFSWLKVVYSYFESDNEFLQKIEHNLINYLYHTYTTIRIDDLFSIIIEYPESLAALEDVKFSITRTDLKSYLIKTLQKAMETRLLHQGVSTSDVLTAYVATIRSLRVLDPSGLLMETITQPVHQYLRSRDDTVRCVVTSLTEEGPNDLAEELVRGEGVQIDEGEGDEGTANWETWTPDPVDCASDSNRPRTSDIISMLVNVYGSKELFVNEYRTLLADRLLSQYSCDMEKEIRYLELLKLRFGDSQLHYCEVMLKDVADSKRINQHIKQHANEGEASIQNQDEDAIPLSAMIVSAQFWPAFKEEKLELHQKLVERMGGYTSAFETLKGSRTLCWKNHLGIVDLEIECGDRVLNVSVSPVHATILMHFRDFDTWTLEALSKKMLVPPTILRKKLNFWQSHGIIAETEADVFKLQEEQKNTDNKVNDDIIVEEYEAESAMASAQDQREEELQTFWSYILGMLMNLDTLPLERIHQMLKMFAFQGPTIECSLQELKVFLDRKVREHQLIYSNGFYRLPN